jgi:predicted metal-dependent phosphoesterase TrpH
MPTAIYDLHTHSTVSDGTLHPAELVQRAAAQGVNVLALTDHDCTAGLAEASAASTNLALRLIDGVEISVTWGQCTIHILGLRIDRENLKLQAGLQALRAYRNERAREIAYHLQRAGIEGALEGALCYAQGNILSRTHFARFLAEKGYARDIQSVFKHYLVRGKPGHVSDRWATLEQALGWICNAGGVPVVAHPARYKFTRKELVQLLGEFKECGGVALEVISGNQQPETTTLLIHLAREMDLFGSCGSDYHGTQNARVELGRLPPFPGDCRPVWSLWQ